MNPGNLSADERRFSQISDRIFASLAALRETFVPIVALWFNRHPLPHIQPLNICYFANYLIRYNSHDGKGGPESHVNGFLEAVLHVKGNALKR